LSFGRLAPVSPEPLIDHSGLALDAVGLPCGASRAVVICRLSFDDLLADASAEIAGNVGILYREVFD
jgi:hypothetical protein